MNTRVVKAYLYNGDWIKVEVPGHDVAYRVAELKYPRGRVDCINHANELVDRWLDEAIENFNHPNVRRIEYWEKGNPKSMKVSHEHRTR